MSNKITSEHRLLASFVVLPFVPVPVLVTGLVLFIYALSFGKINYLPMIETVNYLGMLAWIITLSWAAIWLMFRK